MKRRDAHLILIAAAAAGGALAGAAMPVDLLEWASHATGLSAVIPAAAPPLGETARLGFVGLAAVASAGITALLSPWRKRGGAQSEDGYMSFMALKFAGLFRRGAKQAALTEGELEEPALELAPAVRRADAHPDAPPRAPLVVSRDLGNETSPLMEEEPRGPIVEDVTGLTMPRVPEPLPWDEIESEMGRLLGNVGFRPADEAAPVATVPAVEPTISELTDRLERGIARRRGLEADTTGEVAGADVAPALQPAAPRPAADLLVPQEPEEQPVQVSAELDAALAALRNITARAC